MGFPASHLDLDHEMEDYKGPGILDTPACLVSEGVCSQGPYWFGCESMNVAVLSTNEHGTSTSGTSKKSCGDDPFWIFLTCRKTGSMFTKGVCSTLNAAPPHEFQTCKPGRSGNPAWLRLQFSHSIGVCKASGLLLETRQPLLYPLDQWCVSHHFLYLWDARLPFFWILSHGWKHMAQHIGPIFPKTLLRRIFFAASEMLWTCCFSFFFVLGRKLRDGDVNCEK